ncbi:MAG: hypothetical protein HY445_01240 [Candidatus Niyogibacteria bacterium]|nr:hypothetical protein [Candidatus Niyogibacteria bacterium]
MQIQTPTVTLSAAPDDAINQGGNAVLVWSSANATQCYATSGWSGSKSLAGSEVIAPQSTTSYSITCTNEGQSASDNETIIVSSTASAPIFNVACSVSSPSVHPGQNVTFVAGYAGGIAPVTFVWSGDVTGVGQTRSVSFGTTGSKFATVSATDGQGRTNNSNCSVIVTPATVVTTSTPPPIIVTTATKQPTNYCCSANGTQIFYDEEGNAIEIASADGDQKDRSLLASVFASDTGGPSAFLYLLLFLFIVLAILAVIRYHLVMDRAQKQFYSYGNGNGNDTRTQEHQEEPWRPQRPPLREPPDYSADRS